MAFKSQKQLKDLLNRTEALHKEDIHTLTSGHLNESVATKVPSVHKRPTWPSAVYRPRNGIAQSQVQRHSDSLLVPKKEAQGEALFRFSIGTMAPFSFAPHLPKLQQSSQNGAVGTTSPADQDPAGSSPATYSDLAGMALVEELPAFELMLPSKTEEAGMTEGDLTVSEALPSQDACSTEEDLATAGPTEEDLFVPEAPRTQNTNGEPVTLKAHRNWDTVFCEGVTPKASKPQGACTDKKNSPVAPRSQTGQRNLILRHELVATPACGVTRQDQYDMLRSFTGRVLRKKDATETNILSGNRVVQQHEKKLRKELFADHLEGKGPKGYGPSMNRLHIYADIFSDIIEDSTTFSYILRCIKAEYDHYISYLLDGRMSQHRLLLEQVENMTARGTSRPQELQEAAVRLQAMEEEAWQVLDDNNRLRHEKREQTAVVQNLLEEKPEPLVLNRYRLPEEDEQQKRKHLPHIEQTSNLADEVELTKTAILKKLDELNVLKSRLREEYVPQTVCTHLEQCIKETEIEVQKLLRQNEYFECSVKEMEGELTLAILNADTSEKDARRIWKKVNSSRGLPGGKPTTAGGESSDESDDESKWNWYIS